MKRKNLWLLAPPLVGLVLVWCTGQQRRTESDIYEATLRGMFPRKIAPAGPVFISIAGSDPSLPLLTQFNQLNDGVTLFLPASRSIKANSGMYQVFRDRVTGREGWPIDLSRIYWHGPDNTSVSIDGDDTGGTYTLQRRNGNWEVKTREMWNS